jgi:hypothetical protein
LFIAGENVHDGSSPHVDGPTRTAGKTAPTALYLPERSFASGPVRGW